MSISPYDIGLAKTSANYQPLTPLSFLARSAAVYPVHTAIIHGKQRYSYAEFYARSRRLASALHKAGIKKGETVSAMLANTPAMLECHYGVPMIGAVLNTLNTRLDAAIIAFSLDHAETKVLIVDKEFSATVKQALTLTKTAKPIVIDYEDPEFPVDGERLSDLDYERFIASGDPQFAWRMPDDEWEAISRYFSTASRCKTSTED
jgi:fatty-acyl-CoA synthase